MTELIVFHVDGIRYCTLADPCDYGIYFFEPDWGQGDSILSGTSDTVVRELIEKFIARADKVERGVYFVDDEGKLVAQL